ncbi:MAG: xylose isomerase, partial [Thermotogaceae bacterium]|nr:xylose isomerase [Thermotogaceae bacterium]
MDSARNYFEGTQKIQYEGRDSKNMMSFHHYNPEQMIGNKKMKDHLRFSVAYWHTFCFEGKDMFGADLFNRSWNNYSDPLDQSL